MDAFPELFAKETRPAPVEEPSRNSIKKEAKKAEKARRREELQRAHLPEFRALLNVLTALPDVVPVLASGNGSNTLAAALEETSGAAESKHCNITQAKVESTLAVAEQALTCESSYRSLPEAFGPQEGLEVLASMMDRAPKYQEKFLPQELSLLTKLWALAVPAETEENPPGNETAVVDIGAGNGVLAFLAALTLGGFAILIDRALPPEVLRIEEKLPDNYRKRILRITADVASIDFVHDLEPVLQQHGIKRIVVIAKHLCGLGADLATHVIRKWHDNNNVSKPTESKGIEIVGAVIATCCGHRIGGSEHETYAELYHDDPYLCGLTGGDASHLPKLLSLCTRCVAWRTTGGAVGSRVTDVQVRAGELFEDMLQQPRLNLLRRLFPAAAEVTFVNARHSLQNRCLIAGSESALQRAKEPPPAFVVALCQARSELIGVLGGPLVLKPKGFASSKYDYDGT